MEDSKADEGIVSGGGGGSTTALVESDLLENGMDPIVCADTTHQVIIIPYYSPECHFFDQHLLTRFVMHLRIT